MKEEQKEEILIYQSEEGKTKIEVRLENENIWLTQAQLVELYQSSKSNISEHIKHIFEEGELSEELVVRKFRTTTKHGALEGKTQENWTNFYNLDMIISLFKKYQVKTLSPVEKAYLDTIKTAQKKVEKKAKDENQHE